MRMTAPILLILFASTIAAPAPQASRPIDENTQRVAVPEPSPQAMEYYRSGNLLWAVWQATDLAIPALVLLTGLSVRIRNLARRVGRRWFFILLVYFVLYSVLQWAVQLPLAFYSGYVRQHAYGLSNQTLLKWLRDSLLEGAVGLALGGLLVWLPYWLIRHSPRRWWLVYGDPFAARDVLRGAGQADLGGSLVQ